MSSFDSTIEICTQYAGTSFTRDIFKEDETEWEDEYSASYTLIDIEGNEVTQGNLTKETRHFHLNVPYTATETLEGKYLLLVYLHSTLDAQYKEAIAEFNIKFNKKIPTK